MDKHIEEFIKEYDRMSYQEQRTARLTVFTLCHTGVLPKTVYGKLSDIFYKEN